MSLIDEEADTVLGNPLSNAFTPTESRRQSAVVDAPAAAPAAQPEASGSVDAPSAAGINPSTASTDTWQQEYDAQVQAWRAESAEAREKAEKERLRWEAIRETERQERLKHGSEHTESEWENVSEQPGTQSMAASQSPNPADVRDLVSGESEKRPLNTESQKWEDIPSSMESSFPSLSYPERTGTPSPANLPSREEHAPASATLAIFDSSLSTRTRVTALVSSLTINLLLPFINGVMLGFGEIFAKNVVLEWFGWRTRPPRPPPGSTAAMRGLGGKRSR